MYKLFVKRLLDIILSGIAIVVLSPIYLIISIVVKIQMGSPILFSQDRIGKDEKIFKLYKFRSMTNETDENGELLPEKQRLTKFGIALRSTSLDELPELLMIFKGDMSIVGPRPVLPSELEENYTPFQIQVLNSVKPGLTGYWQAYARNNVGYENFERQKMELFYCRKRSFIFDIKIIFKTFLSVLKRNGAK